MLTEITPTQTIKPTDTATIGGGASFGFSCYTTLAETERIIIEISRVEYNYGLNSYQPTGDKEKYQLERLDYSMDYNDKNQVVFNGGIIRGFRKDGALRYRPTYIPHNSRTYKEVLAQIPDHYHDYARNHFAKEMQEILDKVKETQQNGVKLQ